MVTDERIVRLVKQHAETARLLGVDFVPSYRTGSGTDPVPPQPRVPQVELKPVSPPAAAPKPAVQHTAPQASPAPPAVTAPRVAPSKVAPTAPAAPPALPARDPARKPADVASRLADLCARYEREAPHQHFVTAHTKIVFGDGDPCARLVFVGEAPGEEEDRQGRPFVGRSGELLNKMIVAMGLSRQQVYICNVLKTRPPDNATPTGREIELCEPYLREQLAIIAPEVIVTLGLPAARALLKTQESMTKMRGAWRSYKLPDGQAVPLMPTFHPAYLLRNYTPETRKLVWSDLRQVMDRLGLAAPAKEP